MLVVGSIFKFIYFSMHLFFSFLSSLHGFRGVCSFKQYIPNRSNKYNIKVDVLADSKTFYLVSSKIYTGAGTHALGLPVSTQAVMDLVSSVLGTSRNINTDNYYTSIPLAKEMKS